jgi:hypothetical protein
MDSGMTAMTPCKTLMVKIICLLLGLSIVRCGGGGGGGGDRASDGGTPAVTTAVTIQGVVTDGTPTSPIAQALCRFVEQPNGQQGISAVADTAGNFTLQIPPQEQGVIECQHPILSTLALTTFVSTMGEAAGTTVTEEISPASNVITDIILASNASDPKTLKANLQEELASGEPHLTTLVEAAVIVFKALLETQTVVAVDFGGDGTTGETDGGNGGNNTGSQGDGGGATGQVGDGGEFSPIPRAVCTFTLDQHGMVGANTILGDLFADGVLDRSDLQPIAERVHAVLRPERRQAIQDAFAILFPIGIGRPLQTIANDERSTTPGRFFLPIPAGMPGVIRCSPPDRPNLVLTTCVPARTDHEILGGQDVTPRTDVACDLASQVRQADAKADRESIKVDLISRVIPLQIFLSEDRNGNGTQDPDEEDKDHNGVFDTVVRVRSNTLLPNVDRDLALLVSTATTIFDTMRIVRTNVPPDQTFTDARKDFFTNGTFSAPLAPLAPGVEGALTDATNQAVLGTTDVVKAATTGTLRGTVKDENGRSLAGVQVLAIQQDVRVNVAGNPATTDANGSFHIEQLPIGETTVTASLNGSEVAKITTNVVAIVTINLQLQPTAKIELTPSTQGFGDVPVGGTRARLVTVRNEGTKDLTITAFTIENARRPVFSLGQGQDPKTPVKIAPGASTTISIDYRPTVVGDDAGTLRVASDALNASEGTVVLRGRGAPAPTPQIEVDPSSLTFGDVQVRTDQDVTVTKSVTIRNVGAATLTLSALTIASAEFALGTVTVPKPIPPGAAVTVDVRYRPRNIGTSTGTLRITSDAANTREAIVALSGKGIAAAVAQISVTHQLDFGTVAVGQDQTLAVIIRSSGQADLTLSRLVVAGNASAAFTIQAAPTLPALIRHGATVTAQIRFRPSTAGTVTGTVQVDSNASNTPQATVSLNGTGVAAAAQAQIEVAPTSLALGPVQVGQTQKGQVTMTNTGTADLTVTRLTVGGDAAFTLGTAPKLPARLAPQATATAEVSFRPSTAGTVTGTVQVDSNASNTPQVTIPLSGTGVAAAQAQIEVAPTSLALGPVQVGQTQKGQVTMTNTGTADLTVTELTVGGDDAFTLSTAPKLPARLAPQATATVELSFHPSTAGTVTGTLRVDSNASNTPRVTIPLSGTRR